MPSQPKQLAGKPVGPIGFGLMSLTRPWETMSHEDTAKTMKAALDSGANLWNGGLFYGLPDANSTQLLKYYFEKYPKDADKVILSIKGCYDLATFTADCSPTNIRAEVEQARQVLGGTKKIDIFECARVDPNTPIETSIQTLAELVKEGAIGGIGLSEVSAATIRRAHKVHPIAAVEVEFSLFTTDPLKNGVVATCEELGIPVVAYSPLGVGYLSGQFKSHKDLPGEGIVPHLDRFQPAMFEENIKLVKAVEEMAKSKGVTVGQVAIAWVRSQGAIPIPGTTKVERAVENSKVVSLSEKDLTELQKILETFPVQGDRYFGPLKTHLDG